MRIAKEINWFLSFADSDEQLLYYVDRPYYNFKFNEVKKNNKTILSPSPPIWRPILIEMPTRPLASTHRWISNNGKSNFWISAYGLDGNLIEKWFIQGGRVYSKFVKMGRTVDINVISIVSKYDWARKEK